jgi:hypothetical protein
MHDYVHRSPKQCMHYEVVVHSSVHTICTIGYYKCINILSIAKIDYIVEVTYETHMYLMVLISILFFTMPSLIWHNRFYVVYLVQNVFWRCLFGYMYMFGSQSHFKCPDLCKVIMMAIFQRNVYVGIVN